MVKDWQPSVRRLGFATLFILLLGLCFAAKVLISTSLEQELFERDFCWTNTCVNRYFEYTAQAFQIAKAAIDVTVALATIGGIFVALISYFNTSSNAALSNHIEHLKVFSDYLEAEIKKRDRLSSQLIDTLLLYGTIFNQSRSGKTTVSTDYKSFIEALNSLIEESNERCVVGTPGGFSYSAHQRRIRDHLSRAGITIFIAPRNDYFEMESQLFSLLERISQSFCAPGVLPRISDRKYH